MSSIFLLMKQVLLKTIVIVVGKLIRSRVLWGGVGLRRAPRVEDGARKILPSCGAGRGWGKTKLCGAGMKAPSFGPASPHHHP